MNSVTVNIASARLQGANFIFLMQLENCYQNNLIGIYYITWSEYGEAKLQVSRRREIRLRRCKHRNGIRKARSPELDPSCSISPPSAWSLPFLTATRSRLAARRKQPRRATARSRCASARSMRPSTGKPTARAPGKRSRASRTGRKCAWIATSRTTTSARCAMSGWHRRIRPRARRRWTSALRWWRKAWRGGIGTTPRSKRRKPACSTALPSKRPERNAPASGPTRGPCRHGPGAARTRGATVHRGARPRP